MVSEHKAPRAERVAETAVSRVPRAEVARRASRYAAPRAIRRPPSAARPDFRLKASPAPEAVLLSRGAAPLRTVGFDPSPPTTPKRGQTWPSWRRPGLSITPSRRWRYLLARRLRDRTRPRAPTTMSVAAAGSGTAAAAPAVCWTVNLTPMNPSLALVPAVLPS